MKISRKLTVGCGKLSICYLVFFFPKITLKFLDASPSNCLGYSQSSVVVAVDIFVVTGVFQLTS